VSLYILNEQIKITYWSEFKALVSEVKAIAEQTRKERKRKSHCFASGIVARKIKDIIAPISRIFNYRYNDRLLRELLELAVQRLQLLALELESFFEQRFVPALRRIADTLVSFLPLGEGVQLTILDAEQYHVPNAKRQRLPGFWKWWNYRFINRLGFSNPYKNTKIDYTQLSIKGLWQKQEDRRMDFIRKAYFEEPQQPEVEPEAQQDRISLTNLGLRQLRKVASRLGIPQKINGKDRSKSSLIGELEGLMGQDRSLVSEAIAAALS
jgi:hypothetical protein